VTVKVRLGLCRILGRRIGYSARQTRGSLIALPAVPTASTTLDRFLMFGVARSKP
jgi:hypothetical protein